MSLAIKPLTFGQRQRPAHLSFFGGFRNVSFQLGEISLPAAVDRNDNGSTPAYTKAIMIKSEKVKFPIMVPTALKVMPGSINTVASVFGQRHKLGGYDAVLVARATERLSSFSIKLRTVNDLVNTAANKANATAEQPVEDEADRRLGRSSSARVHNQVSLAGVVVSARFDEGENPKFHIELRQDSNPDNVIPLIYEGRNAGGLVDRVSRGKLIYVDGEFAFRMIPVYKLNEDTGRPLLDKDSQPVVVLDEAGLPARRMHTYIRITAPKDPAAFDTDFGGGLPGWIVKFADELTAGRTRLPSKTVDVPADATVDAPAAATKGKASAAKSAASKPAAASASGESMDDL